MNERFEEQDDSDKDTGDLMSAAEQEILTNAAIDRVTDAATDSLTLTHHFLNNINIIKSIQSRENVFKVQNSWMWSLSANDLIKANLVKIVQLFVYQCQLCRQ